VAFVFMGTGAGAGWIDGCGNDPTRRAEPRTERMGSETGEGEAVVLHEGESDGVVHGVLDEHADGWVVWESHLAEGEGEPDEAACEESEAVEEADDDGEADADHGVGEAFGEEEEHP